VKVHHAPGGNSNFSLGWGHDEPKKPQAPSSPLLTSGQSNPIVDDQPHVVKTGKAQVNIPGIQNQNQSSNPITGEAFKPSVKVHNPPGMTSLNLGGKSNFTLG
jgi:hypothetical protein